MELDKEACLKRIEARLFKEVNDDPYSVWQSENREKTIANRLGLDDDDSFELDASYWTNKRKAHDDKWRWRNRPAVSGVSIELISEDDDLLV
jgi:hypothetical protein